MNDSEKNGNAFEELGNSAKEYLDLKIDEYKLRGVESLSTLLNKFIFIIIATILIGMVLQLFALALGWWIGDLVGSTAVGFLINGCIFILLFVILYLRRDKLFINPLIRLFIHTFFDHDNS